MFRYVLLRFFRAVVTLWIVVSVVFFGMRVSGDPIVMMLGDNATPDDIARLQSAYGLDQSIPFQYLKFLERAAQGDFGTSIIERRPATEVLWSRLPATLELAALSVLLSLAVGIPAGIVAAVHRNSWLDRFIVGVAFIGQAVPGFFIAILFIFLFAVQLGMLPSSGRGHWTHLVLPVVALGWSSLATVARITRVSVLEVLNADFVRTARAKGLSQRAVLVRHVLRNAATPVLTMLGFMLGTAVAGAIIVEKVFAWPGMGRVLEGAVLGRDYPVIQLAVLVIATSVVTVNFIVDVAYGIIDPRISH